ncbi:hypothetical protein Ddye_030578 [Dipteronia dyeriana]|uniref:Uncharacterized protein n=1 Tax=Dipteronia dyeriana TaxID=168575 RepID=A0AAD9TGX7_9ROSI|nr:hypothetical protein Ddye_030578 [Dipteronia dyeriana]
MGEAIHLMCATNINKFMNTSQTNTKSKCKTRIVTCSKTNDSSYSSSSMNTHIRIHNSRKKQRRRRLITVSTSDGKWHGNWNSDYRVSLQDLGLQDLVEVEVDHQNNPLVSVNLCVQKHASFGFSVDGRIITSFTRKCTNCCSPYCRQIDANFNVWILQSREENGTINALPEIGGDPSLSP